MRNYIAIAAALGFLAAVSAPTFAATTPSTTEFAAAKAKVDCKDEKNKDNAACKPKAPKAAKAMKKPVDCTLAKNKTNKACKDKMAPAPK